MQDWTKESLYAKAHMLIVKAHSEDTESELFPFWASLSLEMLCRAALSHIHPTLLADPRDEGGNNLLYACGININSVPRSIQAKTVFLRCEKIIESYDKKALDFCILMAERRNSELHTGADAFRDLKTGDWLSDFYGITIKILDFLEKDLKEFLGKEHAENAQNMLDAEYEKRYAEIQNIISTHKKWFKNLDEDERNKKIAESEEEIKKGAYSNYRINMKKTKCPACLSPSLVLGEVVGYGEPKIDTDGVYTERKIRPTTFSCKPCGLKLSGYPSLRAAGLGDMYSHNYFEEPHEFFNIDVKNHLSPDEVERLYYEMHHDYGND